MLSGFERYPLWVPLNFHMLCDRQFQYTLVLRYICVKTHNVHRNKKCSVFHICLFSERYDICDFDIGCSSVSANFSNIEQGFIGLFRGYQTFITMFPPIVCLLTRYPCHCHSHTMNNSWVYVIYMSTTWNSTQVAYLCLSLLTCRHWWFERWIVLSTE